MTEYIVQGDSLTSIADELRSKTGISNALAFPEDFITAIETLTEIPEAPNDSILFYSPQPFIMKVVTQKQWNGTLYYSTDHETWNEWTGDPIEAGKNGVLYKIYLKGENCTKLCGNEAGSFQFVGASIKCIGNFTYLIPANATLLNYAFEYLFKGCGNVDFDIILPYETLSQSCCLSMFENCTSMQKAPDLPAVTVPSGAYSDMFRGCTALVNPPTIDAENVGQNGCYEMFMGCNNLKNAPLLKASSIGQNGFARMFYDCKSMETIPALYSLALANTCYQYMFSGCNKIKISATQTGDYQNEYRIPYTGTGTAGTNSLNSMFTSTGGTFTGTPMINVSFYTSNTVLTAT